MTCEQRHLMLCQEQMHRKQGITRHQGHKDMENAQYGENTYLLTEKYLLATISSGKRFHSRESIGDVKIERNMNRKKLLSLKLNICSIVFAMILSLYFPASAQDVWTGNINVLLGAKALDNNDWEPADEQGEFGFEIDFREKSWPVNIAIDLLGAIGEGTAFEPFTGMFAKLESTTSEFNIGVRKIWEQFPHVRPFIVG